jgi:DNA-binding transcriptional regulator YhcF (GntR family)
VEAISRGRDRRALPRLEQLRVPETAAQPRSLLVQELLRDIALRSRNSKFQSFYSIRSVAAHFNLPPATIRRIYRKLSDEKLLRLVWGSRTLLEPLATAKRERPRAIAIPVALTQFITSREYRSLIFKLQHEIRKAGDMERLLFFENDGTTIPDDCKECGFRNVDVVMWLLPEGIHRSVLLRLKDMGLDVTCIGYGTFSGVRNCKLDNASQNVSTVFRREVLKAA